MLLASWPVSAQPDEAPATFEFALSAQPLEDALFEWSLQAGRPVFAESALLEGRTSRPVRGRFSARAALERMLEGSGLVVVPLDPETFSIQRDPSAPSPNAPPLSKFTDAEEMIVIGTKRGRSLQDTPTSVTAFDQETLDERGLFDIDDVLLRTANVSTDGSGDLSRLSIRGVTLAGVSSNISGASAGSGTTANVFVDGAPVSFSARRGLQNLWDVGQIEILRGPQSTVQGRNALAGAIVINTADPEYTWGGRARVIVGNEETYQFSAVLTGPIVEDQLAFRFAADHREQDFNVFERNADDEPIRFSEALTLRGKLLLEPQPLPGLRVELSGQYLDTEYGTFNTVVAPVPVNNPAFGEFDPFGNDSFAEGARLDTNEVAWGIADVQYTIDSRWRLISLFTFERTDRATAIGDTGGTENEERTISAELRAEFDFWEGKLTGWVGAYLFDFESTASTLFRSRLGDIGLPSEPPDSVVTIDAVGGGDARNYAGFADVTYRHDEHWEFNVGFRFDWEKRVNDGLNGSITTDPPSCTIASFFPSIGGLPCTAVIPVSNQDPSEASYEAFLPRGSITYHVDSDRSITFGVQRGYRAGGAFPFNRGLLAPTIEEFDPEFITNYELALRSQWFDRRLTINANVFYADWKDQQVTIPGDPNLIFSSRTENAGTSELYGVELSISAQPFESLEVWMALGLLKTEFKDFPFALGDDGLEDGDPATEFENLEGNAFPNAPAVNVSAGFNYAHEGGFYTNWNVAYADAAYSDVTNLSINEGDDYTLLNARIGFRLDFVDVSFFANNLADEEAATQRNLIDVDPATGLRGLVRSPSFTVLDPRTFGVAVSVNY
ncbi:MAG: TonB-dependent receptor [Myxococcota bacterium]